MVWKTIARSAPGTYHQQQQLPCQDYAECRILGDVAIGAVAAGSGNAQLSDLGAKLAVKAMLRYLAATEAWLQRRHYSWRLRPLPPSETLARKLFIKGATEVRDVLRLQAKQ